MPTPLPVKTSHVRLLDVRRDLLPVADLIETCFSATLDQDGRDYLRHIRKAAADPALVRWLPGRGERASTPLFGYVWEQDGRLVGNLSLIPIYKGGRWVYMIANVAVHPDYRRRGIARELTLRALEHIRQHRVQTAWLQVRDDNAAAYHLYQSIGFIERSRRSTWMAPPSAQCDPLPGVQVTPRRAEDWPLQLKWLNELYPLETTWNMSFNAARFSPHWLNQLWQWLNGDQQMHWSARKGGNGSGPAQLLGVISWEPVRGYSDMLWAATSPEDENEALPALLPHAQRALLPRRRPVSVNYPYGRAMSAFLDCGFSLQNTLIWMEYRCN